MKKVTLLLFVFIGTILYSNAQITYSLDFKDPKNVVNAIFYAAQSGDIDILNNFPDPWVENDELTESICLLIDDDEIDNFTSSFKNGKLTGNIDYKTSGNKKLVIVGISGVAFKGKTIKSIVLVNRYDNWFLYRMEY